MKTPSFLSAVPAPFTVEHERLTHYIVSASGQIVATVPAGLAQYDPGSRDESPGAAQALAAVPDLLEALELAEATIQRLAPDGSRATQGTRDVIRAAYLKAGYTL